MRISITGHGVHIALCAAITMNAATDLFEVCNWRY